MKRVSLFYCGGWGLVVGMLQEGYMLQTAGFANAQYEIPKQD